MLVFTAILIEFAYRYSKDKPVRQLRSLHPWASCTGRRRERKAQQAAANGGFCNVMADSTSNGPGVYGPQAERSVRLMLISLCVSTFFIFVRSVYRYVLSAFLSYGRGLTLAASSLNLRCPELLSGWHGPIIQNQTLFEILDGAMILASLVALNILHPLWLLPRKETSSAAVPLTAIYKL